MHLIDNNSRPNDTSWSADSPWYSPSLSAGADHTVASALDGPSSNVGGGGGIQGHRLFWIAGATSGGGFCRPSSPLVLQQGSAQL